MKRGQWWPCIAFFIASVFAFAMTPDYMQFAPAFLGGWWVGLGFNYWMTGRWAWET